MKEDIFVNHLSHFKEIASDCIKLAKKNGAEEVEVDVSESLGKGVATRNCKLESIEQNREKSLTVSVLKNKKKVQLVLLICRLLVLKILLKKPYLYVITLLQTSLMDYQMLPYFLKKKLNYLYSILGKLIYPRLNKLQSNVRILL